MKFHMSEIEQFSNKERQRIWKVLFLFHGFFKGLEYVLIYWGIRVSPEGQWRDANEIIFTLVEHL